MKRKYPKDNDTIKDITKWLSENKVNYKWKTKRKAELLAITHKAVSAVKKRHKTYPSLTTEDLPEITISLNDKKKLVAEIDKVDEKEIDTATNDISHKTTANDNKGTSEINGSTIDQIARKAVANSTKLKAENEADTKVKADTRLETVPQTKSVSSPESTPTSEPDALSKNDLLDKILQTDEKDPAQNVSKASTQTVTLNKSKITTSSDATNTNEPTKINANQLRFQLASNEWLLVVTMPEELPADPVLDLNTGDIYSQTAHETETEPTPDNQTVAKTDSDTAGDTDKISKADTIYDSATTTTEQKDTADVVDTEKIAKNNANLEKKSADNEGPTVDRPDSQIKTASTNAIKKVIAKTDTNKSIDDAAEAETTAKESGAIDKLEDTKSIADSATKPKISLAKQDFELDTTRVVVYYNAHGDPVKSDDLSDTVNNLNKSDAIIAVDNNTPVTTRQEQHELDKKAPAKKSHHVLAITGAIVVFAVVFILIKIFMG